MLIIFSPIQDHVKCGHPAGLLASACQSLCAKFRWGRHNALKRVIVLKHAQSDTFSIVSTATYSADLYLPCFSSYTSSFLFSIYFTVF